jgi:hypothetical protein
MPGVAAAHGQATQGGGKLATNRSENRRCPAAQATGTYTLAKFPGKASSEGMIVSWAYCEGGTHWCLRHVLRPEVQPDAVDRVGGEGVLEDSRA